MCVCVCIVEKLQALVNGSLGGVIASIQEGPPGPVCLPRRAETFGGFDSHQMHGSKGKCVCVCVRAQLFAWAVNVQGCWR